MWAFEVTPADLPIVYWSHTLDEIRQYARLRLSWFQAQAFQQHEVMRIILQQAFGSSKDKADENVTEHKPQSADEAKSMLGNMFKK